MNSLSFIMKGKGNDNTGEEKENKKSNWIMREYFYKAAKSSTTIGLPRRSAYPGENIAICMISHREGGLGDHEEDESEEDRRSTVIHEDNVFNALMEQTFAFVDGNNQAAIGRLVCHPNGNCTLEIDDHVRQYRQDIAARRQAQFVRNPDQRSGLSPIGEDEVSEDHRRVEQVPLIPGAKYTSCESNQSMGVDQEAVDYSVTVLMNQRSSVPDDHNNQAVDGGSFSGSNDNLDKQEQLLEPVGDEKQIVEGQGNDDQSSMNEGLLSEPNASLVKPKQLFEAVSDENQIVEGQGNDDKKSVNGGLSSESNADLVKPKQLFEAVDDENQIVEGHGNDDKKSVNAGLLSEPFVDLVKPEQLFEAVSLDKTERAVQSGDEASNSEVFVVSPFPRIIQDCSYSYSDEFGRMNFVGWVDEAWCC